MLIELLIQHKYLAAGALIIGALVRLLKTNAALEAFPHLESLKKHRPWIALALGLIHGMMVARLEGKTWVEGLVPGFLSGLLAISGHELLIEALRGGKELGTDK